MFFQTGRCSIQALFFDKFFWIKRPLAIFFLSGFLFGLISCTEKSADEGVHVETNEEPNASLADANKSVHHDSSESGEYEPEIPIKSEDSKEREDFKEIDPPKVPESEIPKQLHKETVPTPKVDPKATVSAEASTCVRDNTALAPPTTTIVSSDSTFPADVDLNAIAGTISKNHYKAPLRKEVNNHLVSPAELGQYLQSLDNFSSYISKEKIDFIKKRATWPRLSLGMDIIESNGCLLGVPFKQGSLSSVGFKAAQYLTSINQREIAFNDFSSYRFLADLDKDKEYDIQFQRSAFSTKQHYEVFPILSRQDSHHAEIFGDTHLLVIKRIDDLLYRFLRKHFEKYGRPKQIILDFRHSIGGNPKFVDDVIGYFLVEGKKIASYETSQPMDSDEDYQRYYKAPLYSQEADYNLQDTPVIVLTSQFTASASEIFIHALKVYRPDVRIIGKPTAGKCLAQKIFPLSNGTALKLSVYEMVLTDERPCEGSPVTVDREVKDIELMPVGIIMKQLDSW